MTVLPMFPLGSVLFPSLFLPLHVFEPRYRSLVEDCLAADSEFGVVLIERGSEVGGGDVRTDIGTLARIIEHREFPDGRIALATVGVRRLRVERWLDDDPYPRAEVVDFDDDDDQLDVGAAAYSALIPRVRKALGLKAELGEPAASATAELSDEPGIGSFQVAALGPFTPLDQQKILATAGVADRMLVITEMLDEELETLEARIAMGTVD